MLLGTPDSGEPTTHAQDYEDVADVNEKLDSMGYGIGQRLIDELLAKSNVGQVACQVMSRAMFPTRKHT